MRKIVLLLLAAFSTSAFAVAAQFWRVRNAAAGLADPGDVRRGDRCAGPAPQERCRPEPGAGGPPPPSSRGDGPAGGGRGAETPLPFMAVARAGPAPRPPGRRLAQPPAAI